MILAAFFAAATRPGSAMAFLCFWLVYTILFHNYIYTVKYTFTLEMK